jgi:hypothetical protein
MTEYGYVKPQKAGHNADTYHTDNSCRNAPSDPQKVPLERIERSNKELCDYCAGVVEYTEERSKSLREQLESGEIEV